MKNAKTLFPVCGRTARLPEHLVQATLRTATPYGSADEADVERNLWCHLQVHGEGDHFALVLDLAGVDTGAIWTRWADGRPLAAPDVRPDCSFIDPESLEACCEFAFHPGAHTRQLTKMPAEIPQLPTSAARNPATATPLIQRPASTAGTSPGRTWSIGTTGGFTLTGYLPPWADEDPSESDVPLEGLSAKLIDLAHWRSFDGQRMRIHNPAHADGGAGLAVEESLFDGHIACYPYSEDPQERSPHTNVRVVGDLWLNKLTPEDLTKLTAQLRAQADRLERDVTPTLEEARNDWAARQIGRPNYVLQ